MLLPKPWSLATAGTVDSERFLDWCTFTIHQRSDFVVFGCVSNICFFFFCRVAASICRDSRLATTSFSFWCVGGNERIEKRTKNTFGLELESIDLVVAIFLHARWKSCRYIYVNSRCQNAWDTKYNLMIEYHWLEANILARVQCIYSIAYCRLKTKERKKCDE